MSIVYFGVNNEIIVFFLAHKDIIPAEIILFLSEIV